jgi:hypothetical protein
VFNCFLLGQCLNFCADKRLISDHIASQHSFPFEILPTDWAHCTEQRSKCPRIIRVLIMCSTAAASAVPRITDILRPNQPQRGGFTTVEMR